MANYDERTGFTYVPIGQLDTISTMILTDIFDEQTDMDVVEIIDEMRESKVLKKVCIVKTLVYPYEMLLTKLLLNKKFYQDKKSIQKLYWQFLRGKVKIKEFKQELVKLAKIVNNQEQK